jgi:hypothetical protein
VGGAGIIRQRDCGVVEAATEARMLGLDVGDVGDRERMF